MADRFEIPAVTDDDIRWACRQLGEKEDAFHGTDGTDQRAQVLKNMGNLDVAACPGSGKTTLLVAKLAILAQSWEYRTRGICVLSHTNVARREIEGRLGNSAAGIRLLNYPHFVGTIHNFVNVFLAVPWLQSLGYQVRVIDNDISQQRRWQMLSFECKIGLENAGYGPQNLVAKSKDFSVGDIPWGKTRTSLGRTTKTYKEIVSVCIASAKEGYFCHDEMFMWAYDLLDTHPEIVVTIRSRYPLLFVDECQDNDDEQSRILHRIFCDGAGVVCQRFGDSNQAIFNERGGVEAAETAYRFPLSVIRKDLPNSHRFGQKIADLADPLGLVPYKLKGQGPRNKLASGAEHAEHTIFLFHNQAGAERVLTQFGDLLLATFSDVELRTGLFKAVGQVHKKTDDKRFPGHVGHYWKHYDPGLTKWEPRPESFPEYVFVGLSRSRLSGHCRECVEKIAEGLLELAKRIRRDIDFPKRSNRHRMLCELLRVDMVLRNAYEAFVVEVSLGGAFEKANWDQKWRVLAGTIAEKITDAPLGSARDYAFLNWPDLDPLSTGGAQAPTKRNANIIYHTNKGREAAINLGSIHSVKGETHTATLILETFYHDHNISSLKAWFLGTKSGEKKNAVRINDRLKLHYVAMTRPSHLVCVAMLRATFEENGSIDQNCIKLLEGRGWKVREV